MNNEQKCEICGYYERVEGEMMCTAPLDGSGDEEQMMCIRDEEENHVVLVEVESE